MKTYGLSDIDIYDDEKIFAESLYEGSEYQDEQPYCALAFELGMERADEDQND